MALGRNDVMWFERWSLDCGYICSFFTCLCSFMYIAIEYAHAYAIVAAKNGHYKAGTLYWARKATASAVENASVLISRNRVTRIWSKEVETICESQLSSAVPGSEHRDQSAVFCLFSAGYALIRTALTRMRKVVLGQIVHMRVYGIALRNLLRSV